MRKGRKAGRRLPGTPSDGLKRLLRWYLSIRLGVGTTAVFAAITAILLPVNVCTMLHLGEAASVAVVAIWQGLTALYIYNVLKAEAVEADGREANREETDNEMEEKRK